MKDTNNTQCKFDSDANFYSHESLVAREQELRKINEKLDFQLSNVNTDGVEIPTLNFHERKKNGTINHNNMVNIVPTSYFKENQSFNDANGHDDLVATFKDLTLNNNNVKIKTNIKEKSKQKKVSTSNKIDNTSYTTENHLQKVQIKAMTKQLNQAIKSSSDLSNTNNQLLSKLSQSQEMNRKLEAQLNKLQASIKKNSHEREANQNRVDDLSIENSSLKKELSKLHSIVKDCESKSQNNEVKLKRALESLEKYKTMVKNYASSKKENDIEHGQEKKVYETKITELSTQRDELIVGFKKQMQLINVLKRQKVHLEASRLLDFTEEEFLKVIDWRSVSTKKNVKR